MRPRYVIMDVSCTRCKEVIDRFTYRVTEGTPLENGHTHYAVYIAGTARDAHHGMSPDCAGHELKMGDWVPLKIDERDPAQRDVEELTKLLEVLVKTSALKRGAREKLGKDDSSYEERQELSRLIAKGEDTMEEAGMRAAFNALSALARIAAATERIAAATEEQTRLAKKMTGG